MDRKSVRWISQERQILRMIVLENTRASNKVDMARCGHAGTILAPPMLIPYAELQVILLCAAEVRKEFPSQSAF
jgi:hypothetical protein